jgi:hypothetical protein
MIRETLSNLVSEVETADPWETPDEPANQVAPKRDPVVRFA